MKIKLLNILTGFFVASFGNVSSQNIDFEISTCVETNFEDFSLKSIFNQLEEIELSLIEAEYLKNKNKSEYLKLLSYLANDKILSKKFLDMIESNYNGYIAINHSLFNGTYKNCVYKILGKNRESKYLDELLTSIDILESKSFQDEDTLKKVIDITDFNNKESRLMICHWLYTYSWSVYQN